MAVSQAIRIANRGVCSEHGIFSTSCYCRPILTVDRNIQKKVPKGLYIFSGKMALYSMQFPARLKSPLTAGMTFGLLLAISPLEAAQKIYVKNYTPLLSAPSKETGKALKNLALNEVVTVIYTEEALGVTNLAETWVRVRAADGREGYVQLGNLSKEKQPELNLPWFSAILRRGRM